MREIQKYSKPNPRKETKDGKKIDEVMPQPEEEGKVISSGEETA